MWFATITGTNLQDRLDSFYENQAEYYDGYRFRMLHGRPKMLQGVARHLTITTLKPTTTTTSVVNTPPAAAPSEKGIVWVDLACGTGANTENFASSIVDGTIAHVYLVDLCNPLCKVARRDRGEKFGHDKVHVVHGDATDFDLLGLPPSGTADLVTISYSLVMTPNWRKCIY